MVLVKPARPAALALHIWIDAENRHIVRVLHDNADQEEVRRVEKYNLGEGLVNLYRIVVTEGTIRIVPPERKII